MKKRELLWLLLLAAGCGGERAEPQAGGTPAPAAQDGPELYRGIALRAPAGVRLAVCGTADTLQLVDAAAAVVQDSAAYVVVSGQRTGTALTVERVLYASRDRFECYADWSAFVYRATGSQPGWVLEVSDSAAQLRREGGQSWQWTAPQKDSSDGRIMVKAKPADGEAFTLTLTLRECRFPNGARSAWSADLVHKSDRLRGCAVFGVR